MANAMVALATTTLGSTATTVTFGSIPATYRDLRIVISAAPNGTGYPGVQGRYNGDTGNNYYTVRMGGNGSSTNSSVTAGADPWNNWAGSYGLGSTAGAINNFEIDILDYATDKHKTSLCRGNTPGMGVEASAARWASTAAITSVTVLVLADAFAVGSTFSLYGIVS